MFKFKQIKAKNKRKLCDFCQWKNIHNYDNIRAQREKYIRKNVLLKKLKKQRSKIMNKDTEKDYDLELTIEDAEDLTDEEE